MKTFETILKELLKEYGISQNELSKRLGLAQATVNAWGLGIKEPSYIAILKICSEFDIEPNELFNWNAEVKQEIQELIKSDYVQRIDELHSTIIKHNEIAKDFELQEANEIKEHINKQLIKYNGSLSKWFEAENTDLKIENQKIYEDFSNYYKKLDKLLNNMKIKFPEEYYNTIYTNVITPSKITNI